MKARKMLAAAFLIGLFGAFGPDAHAAGEARLDLFPESPRAGDRVTIQLRTYDFFPDRRPPAIFPESYPMTLNVLDAKGRHLALRFSRDPEDPYVWRRSYRFPAAGRWTVCGANWQASIEGCVENNLTRRIVRVRPRGAPVDVWHRLQRPLQTPSAADDKGCPTTAASGDLSRIGFAGVAWGPGPVYPGGMGAEEPLLRYADPIPRDSGFFGSAWFGNKINWLIDRARYLGPVLIRGRRVDGPDLLRFDRGRVPPRELRIGAHETSRPSFTRVRAPGCYAYQVDGLSFSYTIVFNARPG